MKRKDEKKNIQSIIEERWNVLFPIANFRAGKDIIQYAGSTFDAKEINAALDVLLDGWFGLSNKATEFENNLAKYVEMKNGIVVNSGSSANLLAITALKSLKLNKRLQNGDEIITQVSGFPTTINPIVQNNLVPVFVDVELGSYNIDIKKIEPAISKKTKAIFIVHTLGNPVDMKPILEIAKKHNLFVIEDCCDALGSEIYNKKVGSFGDISTFSFYPAHHITMGEGGAVLSSNSTIARIIRSLRDWGRDCFCAGETSMNKNGACGNRFDKWLPDLDEIIDHKYVYSEIGYNLKPLELQCAMGLQQLRKLSDFIEKRNNNFMQYYKFFKNYEKFFILPKWHKKASPSWFAFPLSVRKDAPFKRFDLVDFLENHKIQTRNLFAGNILLHPAYKHINYRQVGNFNNSDFVTTNTFFLGVYPGINEKKMDYILAIIRKFFAKSQ